MKKFLGKNIYDNFFSLQYVSFFDLKIDFSNKNIFSKKKKKIQKRSGHFFLRKIDKKREKILSQINYINVLPNGH